MTLWMILTWWRQDLIDWWQQRTRTAMPVSGREGRMVAFSRTSYSVMGYPTYMLYARRGGFPLGQIMWRNQWGYYAYYPTADGVLTPINREIIAEIYAMLKELGATK